MLQKTILSKSVNIYVPTKDNNGRDLSSLVKSIITKMSNRFGGVTCHNAIGSWADNNTIYNDDVIIMTSYNHDNIIESDYIDIVEQIIEQGHQLAVSVELNNQLLIYNNEVK